MTILTEKLKPAIPALFRSRRPSAILRRIWAVIISPIELMFRRRRQTDIEKKVFKRFAPARADRDPSSTIIIKPRMAGIEATAFYVRPTPVHRVIVQWFPSNIIEAHICR